ncbi:MAG: hypothetical protein IK057_03575 [Clostridia bacterium]|nr:hypothetical protein [Clostridia bacterium]
MKKALLLILVIVFALHGFCGIVSAREDEILPFDDVNAELPTGGVLFEAECDESLSNIEPVRTRGTLKPIKEYLEEELLAHEKVIKLSQYQYVFGGDFQRMYHDVIVSNYKIMAYTGFKYWADNETNFVTAVSPQYIFDTVEEDVEARAFMDEQIRAQYLDKVSNIPYTDVAGKILVIYDLFCEKNAYAYEEAEDPDNKDIFTAYNLFKYNRAVCQGNSIALKGIYDALNEQLKQEMGTDEDIIETGFCRSNGKKHIWNVVKIGGKWYHLDVTWDDNPQYEEYALHRYFLVSDDQMNDHKVDDIEEWDYCGLEGVVCDDKKYETGYFFNDIAQKVSRIAYESGKYNIYVPVMEQPFVADNLKSTKILATDVFIENEKQIIRYISKEDVTSTLFVARYDEGHMTKFGEFGTKELKANGINTIRINNWLSNCRLFHWSEESLTPLCRVIDLE